MCLRLTYIQVAISKQVAISPLPFSSCYLTHRRQQILPPFSVAVLFFGLEHSPHVCPVCNTLKMFAPFDNLSLTLSRASIHFQRKPLLVSLLSLLFPWGLRERAVLGAGCSRGCFVLLRSRCPRILHDWSLYMPLGFWVTGDVEENTLCASDQNKQWRTNNKEAVRLSSIAYF